MANQFHGEGFDKATIDGEEAARFRHLFQVVDGDFVYIDPEALETIQNFETIISGIFLLGKIIKVGGPVFVFFTAIGYAASQLGWF